MSAYGRIRERYQVWLAKECLPNEAPETLLLRTDNMTHEQQEELREWVKDFAAVGDK